MTFLSFRDTKMVQVVGIFRHARSRLSYAVGAMVADGVVTQWGRVLI